MTYRSPDDAIFRLALLVSPGERQDVDYKMFVSLRATDEFTLRLIKHIQGMAMAGERLPFPDQPGPWGEPCLSLGRDVKIE
jgi:hypothetical protein